jgi:hypothetical protein
MNRQTIEAALDAGQLYINVGLGKYWRCRRNGATQTWKRDPSRFRIPVKAGLYKYWAIREDNMSMSYWRIGEDAQ